MNLLRKKGLFTGNKTVNEILDIFVKKDIPNTTRFRIYADGTVVHEDDFDEVDNSQPYYDDYSEHVVPDEIIERIQEEVEK